MQEIQRQNRCNHFELLSFIKPFIMAFVLFRLLLWLVSANHSYYYTLFFADVNRFFDIFYHFVGFHNK